MKIATNAPGEAANRTTLSAVLVEDGLAVFVEPECLLVEVLCKPIALFRRFRELKRTMFF